MGSQEIITMPDQFKTPEGRLSVDEKTLAALIKDPNFNPDVKDMESRTLLSHAAEAGCEAVVKLLLALPNVDVNSTDHRGYTPLFWAALRGHTGVVRILLENPIIEPNLEDENGMTVLFEAADEERQPVVDLLLAHPDVQKYIRKDFPQRSVLVLGVFSRIGFCPCNIVSAMFVNNLSDKTNIFTEFERKGSVAWQGQPPFFAQQLGNDLFILVLG